MLFENILKRFETGMDVVDKPNVAMFEFNMNLGWITYSARAPVAELVSESNDEIYILGTL